jgi:antitoxin component YwqK of YwqJK toxin-antitoxin module
MKATLFALFVALLMVGCRGEVDHSDEETIKDVLETAIDCSELRDRNGSIYKLNNDSTYTGWAKKVNESGQLKMLVQLKEGKVRRIKRWWDARSPAFDIWLDPGSISLELTNLSEWVFLFRYQRADPMFDGDVTFWHKNGQKLVKGFVTQGKNEGLQTRWHENGQKEGEGNWKDGKLDGLLTEWYENGQKKQEATYKDDKRDGLMTRWYEDGQKKAEVTWKDGKQDGLTTAWYENGDKKWEGNFKGGTPMTGVSWKPNGEKCPVTNVKDGNGVSVWYYESGKKRVEGNYRDGKTVPAVAWKPNGDKCPVTNVVNGNGVWVWYNDDGTESFRTTYKDGEIVKR